MPLIRTAGLAVAMSWLTVTSAQAQTETPLWRDSTASVQQRAEALVGQMTLDEKAEQVGHTAPSIPRLSVPDYNWWNEGLHGVARAGHATVFPQAIGLAASWDTQRMRAASDIIALEFRAKYNETVAPDGSSDWYRGLTVWSPNINIFRDPRWGRGQETYGEDPHLTGQMALAFIAGLQGDDPDALATVATVKHYAVHSGPESNRHREDVHPSAFDLHDTYLPAFRTTVTEGGVASVMCAYNAVDGIPACAHDGLMDGMLRDEWGFDGYVVSDCGAAANVFRPDALAWVDDPVEGIARTFDAGMDLVCGDYRNNMSTEAEHIAAAVRTGRLDEAVLDRALVRLVSARIRLGLFDPAADSRWASLGAGDYDTPAHRAVARDMAEASMVLLRNDGGLLPLAAPPQSIAVIGPNADSYDALVGNYNGLPSDYATVLDGLRARFPDADIHYEMGTGLVAEAEPDVPSGALCADAACETPGLLESRYRGDGFEGEPDAQSSRDGLHVLWSGEARDDSVRWTGWLNAPATGRYRLRMVSDDPYRITIDGEVRVDAWEADHPPSVPAGAVDLVAGEPVPITIEARQVGPRGDHRLVWTPPGNAADAAVAAAGAADLTIFVGGLSWRVEGEEMRVDAPGFSGGDRTAIGLPGPQQDLLQRVHATGTPVVLVLMSGSALAVNWADAHIPAILQAGYPGGDGGHAVAGLIAGDFNPAGRLPYTVYRSVDDLPPFADYSMAGRTYRYFDGEPLYPFGYGLSFTQFDYTNASAPARVEAGEPFDVEVDLTNTGPRTGEEVVQLYVTRPDIDGAPLRSLQGFQRLRLDAGETRTVRFTLDPRALSTVDGDGERHVEPGPVTLWIGGGQPVRRDGLPSPVGLQLDFNVEGRVRLEP